MVILYTTHCPKCKVLTKKLEQKAINFKMCEDTSIMKKKNIVNLPVLEVNGEMMDFVKAVEWINKQEE